MAFFPTTTEPEALIEEYAVEVARRLGYKGPQARNQAVLKALQTLINVLPPAQLTEEERAKSDAMWARIFEWGRKYREQNPYDPANPESRVWQEELYGADGLPASRENLTKAERSERMQHYVDFGVAFREQHPYDDDNPPSKAWQDELYDENGLPA